MSVLAHVLERAGLATVGISLVRRQAENARPPRMLHCQFPLGRPLGRPGDPAFQRDVLERAFALLSRDDVPVLVDHPTVIDDESGDPVSCPLPPRHDPDAPPWLDEARGLRAAYERSLAAHGRTLVGRVTDADGIGEVLTVLARIADGASPDEVGWDAATILAATQDVRAYYEEAALSLVGVGGARRIESWFYDHTEAGALMRRLQEALREAGADRNLWYYVLPATQSR